MKIVQITADSRDVFERYEDPSPYFGSAPAALLEGFQRRSDCEVHVVCCNREAMAAPERIADNVFYHSLVVRRAGRLRHVYMGQIMAVRRLLRQLRPDIVHGQGTERECGIAAVCSGYPNVLTIHGNLRVLARVHRAPPFSHLWTGARLERLTIPRSDGVVCISQHTRAAVEHLARRTWLVPNAVDRHLLHAQTAPASRPLVLCLGSIVPWKSPHLLIEAADALVAEHEFDLVFAGSTNEQTAYFRDFIGRVNQRPWCSYRGNLRRGEALELLKQAHALILPTREDNCPMILLEAMALGVPAAASRVGGIPELIRHGETGLLFDANDVSGLRESMDRLLVRREEALQMGALARDEARRRFDPDVVADRHMDIYREVTGISA